MAEQSKPKPRKYVVTKGNTAFDDSGKKTAGQEINVSGEQAKALEAAKVIAVK